MKKTTGKQISLESLRIAIVALGITVLLSIIPIALSWMEINLIKRISEVIIVFIYFIIGFYLITLAKKLGTDK